MIGRRMATWLLPAAICGAAVMAVEHGRRAGTPPPAPTASPLLDGVTFERVLPGGESARYPLPLEAGRYLRLEVGQHNVDAVLRLLAPDGSVLIESDGINGREGPESISMVSDAAGVYTLEVLAMQGESATGRITVRVAEQAEASSRNRLRVAADWTAVEGRRLYLLSTGESTVRAIVELDNAAARFRTARDAGGESDSLIAIGAAEIRRERHAETLEPLGRGLDLARSIEDPRREAELLWLRGWSYSRLGEWQRAVDDLVRALPLWRTLDDAPREVRTLTRLVDVYLEIGDERRALDYASSALRVARPLADTRELCEALNTVGTVHLWRGEPEPALEPLREALAIGRRRGYRDAEANNLISIGVALRMLGRNAEAREALEAALALSRQRGDRYLEAMILLQMAATHTSTASAAARELLESSLEAARAAGYDSGQAASLTLLAHASLGDGDLDRARRLVEEAVSLRERLWRRAPTADLQAGYLADQFPTYELYVDVLAAIDRAGTDSSSAALAFSVVDGARARALRQELVRARVEVRGGVSAELLDRRRDLLAAETRVKGAGDAVRSYEARTRIEAIEAELRRVERQIAEASPRWAALMLPGAITVEEVQRDLLDPETVLLEYSLGQERSHLFEVSAGSLRVVELPARAAIEAAARRVTDAVVARNRRVRFETVEERRDRIATADAQFAGAARELSEMLLGAVADRLEGKRLALVTDGALQYVPFGALPEPGSASEAAPLALGHEIVHLPSASALREIRRQSRPRSPRPATLAVLADPVLRPNDGRLRRGGPVGTILASLSGGDTLAQAPAGGTPARWPDLPYAREEAEAILSLVPAGERFGALGLDASRATAASPELSRYRIIHFATHVWLDDEQPELSGIVLSQFDARGRQQNGLLSLFDVYDLRLSADLVVLSGCRTALGKEIRGEGLVGLTRGFMFAGAPRVVVSLWDVQDRATAELMKRMYSSLLLEGRSPAAALREAQSAMSRSAEWGAPYYWAGFVLEGDWR